MVWLGEAVSIGAMEVAMNVTDYLLGGLAAASVTDLIFWTSLGFAVVAGDAAGYPVNYFMIRRGIKEKCH